MNNVIKLADKLDKKYRSKTAQVSEGYSNFSNTILDYENISDVLGDFIIALREANIKVLDDLEQDVYQKAQPILQEQTQLIDQAIQSILPQVHILDSKLEKIISGEE